MGIFSQSSYDIMWLEYTHLVQQYTHNDTLHDIAGVELPPYVRYCLRYCRQNKITKDVYNELSYWTCMTSVDNITSATGCRIDIKGQC